MRLAIFTRDHKISLNNNKVYGQFDKKRLILCTQRIQTENPEIRKMENTIMAGDRNLRKFRIISYNISFPKVSVLLAQGKQMRCYNFSYGFYSPQKL